LKHKVRLLASSTLLVAVTAFSPSAFAQTNPAAQAAASNTIEELVVTAEKRAQSLQDVPVAISAFSSQTRDLVGINSIQDLTNFTPGLNYSSGNDRNSIRGVGRLTNSHPIANAVALYDDGIFSDSTVPAGKTPIFTDRVEVLRGPQGTLYGRNSIGGAINVISKRPTEDPYAEIRATVANYGRTLLEAAVSGPLAPNLQYRLVGNWEKQTDGYFTNVVPGKPSEGNVIDQWTVEGQLQAKVGDRLDLWGKVDLTGWNNGGGGPGARNGYTAAPYNFGEFNALSPNAGFACAPGGVVSNVVNTSPTGCTNPASTDPRKFASNFAQQVSLDDTYNFAFNANYHFDNFDVKYIGGGSKYHYKLETDISGGSGISSFTINPATFNPLLSVAQQPCPAINLGHPGGCAGLTVFPELTQTFQEDFLNFSHEINIASTGNGPLQWLGGLYYYKEHIIQPVFQSLLQQPQLAGAIANIPGLPAAALDTQNRTFDDRPDVQDESYAVFGQIDWKFTDSLKLTAGLRWSHDHEFGSEAGRDVCFATTACGVTPQLLGQFTPAIDVTGPNFFTGGVPAGVVPNGQPGGVTFTPDGFGHRSYDGTWSATTGTLGVEWDPSPGTLVYARYNRGYKQGGFQVGAVAFGTQFPSTNPEHLNDYEVGFKKDFFNRTLQTDVAIFYYDYQGLQAPLTVVNNTGGLAPTQNIFLNVPSAFSEGIEFESTWNPIDNLRILFNYSFNPTGINNLSGIVDPTDPLALAAGAKPLTALQACSGTGTTATAANPNPNPGCDVNTGFVQRGQNLKGNVLPNAARNKVALDLLYTYEMERGSLTPSISYVWRDQEYSGLFKRDYDASPAWDQVDSRITWKSKESHFTVIAYVKNLFDTLGYDSGVTGTRNTGVFPLSTIAAAKGLITPGAPSVPGNTNGAVPGLSQSGLITGFGANGITRNFALTPPRTFGVEFQYRF